MTRESFHRANQQGGARLYPRGIAGRDCDHRRAGGAAPPRDTVGPRGGAAFEPPQQSQESRARLRKLRVVSKGNALWSQVRSLEQLHLDRTDPAVNRTGVDLFALLDAARQEVQPIDAGANGPIGTIPVCANAAFPDYHSPIVRATSPMANEMDTDAFGLWRSSYRGCVGSGDLYGQRCFDLLEVQLRITLWWVSLASPIR